MSFHLAGSARALLWKTAEDAGLDMPTVIEALELADGQAALDAFEALWKQHDAKQETNMPGTPIKPQPPAPPSTKTPTKPETPAAASKGVPAGTGGLICKVCGNKVK